MTSTKFAVTFDDALKKSNHSPDDPLLVRIKNDPSDDNLSMLSTVFNLPEKLVAELKIFSKLPASDSNLDLELESWGKYVNALNGLNEPNPSDKAIKKALKTGIEIIEQTPPSLYPFELCTLIGYGFRIARTNLKLTREDVTKQFEVSKGTLVALENGMQPKSPLQQKMAERYLTELLGGPEHGSRSLNVLYKNKSIYPQVINLIKESLANERGAE